MKVIYRIEALSDLQELLEYISEDSPAASARVVSDIRRSITRLELFPHSGRIGIVDGTWELVVSRLPYIVVYRIHSFVEILSIFHTAQDRE